MNYEIKSKKLTVMISSKGAELQSIQDCGGNEYLWQGDEAYWGDRAPNIFPYVARLTKGQYRLDGQIYRMSIHGFVMNMELQAVIVEESKIVFQLCANEMTKEQYPYLFTYCVIYELKDDKLEVTYTVENQDKKKMYFGIGGHPGFNVPIKKELEFQDYYLEFSEPCQPNSIGFTKECFLSGKKEVYPLEQDCKLQLQHSLFAQDAIILENMSKVVTLKSDKDNKFITIEYPYMNYLGVWHMPQMDAPYVCIEPWSSLPSRDGVVEDLSTQPGLIVLESQHRYENKWSISIGS